MLVEKIEKILEENDFEYCEYSGCFDIAARRDFLMFLKILTNIDSFQFEQAKNMKILSSNLNAFSALIGLHTRYERLDDNVVYERYDIPTFTPRTLENILQENLPFIYRFRGGLFAEIEPLLLKRARENSGLTQEELARRVGITKKSVYEHEHKKMRALYHVVKKMEKILNEKIIQPFDLPVLTSEKNEAKTKFEHSVSHDLMKIGFETNFVYQTPFNIIAKERILILSDAEERERRIRRNIPYLSEFSEVSEKPVIVITKDECNIDLPSIKKSELKDLSPRDLKKIARS